jgi:hypothetical protein
LTFITTDVESPLLRSEWVSGFRSRYFKVHSGGLLSYYLNEPDSKPRHEWSLDGATISVKRGLSGECFPFDLHIASSPPRILRLQAPDFQQWVAWLDALTKAGATAQDPQKTAGTSTQSESESETESDKREREPLPGECTTCSEGGPTGGYAEGGPTGGYAEGSEEVATPIELANEVTLRAYLKAKIDELALVQVQLQSSEDELAVIRPKLRTTLDALYASTDESDRLHRMIHQSCGCLN